MCMLVHEVAIDVINNYVTIGESIRNECLKKFITDIVSVFEDEYLLKPNPKDVECLLKKWRRHIIFPIHWVILIIYILAVEKLS